MYRILLFLACAFAAGPAGALESFPWREFTDVTLNIAPVGSTSSASYRALLDFTANDLLMDVDVRDPPQRRLRGSVGVIGGRVLISKGLALVRGEENDAIDGPMLTIQLVEIVLERAVPAGPSSVAAEWTPIDYTGKEGVKFATQTGNGYLPMPWSAKGQLRRTKSGAIEFKFDLVAGTPGGKDGMRNRCSGVLRMRSAPVFSNAMSLAEWTTYPEDARSKSVGEVRARIRKKPASP